MYHDGVDACQAPGAEEPLFGKQPGVPGPKEVYEPILVQRFGDNLGRQPEVGAFVARSLFDQFLNGGDEIGFHQGHRLRSSVTLKV